MPKLGLGFQAMDSPETAKLTTFAPSDSPQLQDSPFSNFVSNLSPIENVRSTRIVGELSRLNSPPIVFKSPHTKHRKETNIVKRSESLQLAHLETSQGINTSKECNDCPAETVCQSELIAQTQKSNHVVGSSETRPSSSSGCVDGFLADPEADCVNSAKSATPTLKQSSNAPKSDQIEASGSKKTILLFDGQNGTWVNEETDLDAFLFSPEQTENGIQGESGLDVKSNGIEVEQQDGEWAFGCPDINISSDGGHASTIQACQSPELQGVEIEHQSDRDCASQPLADSLSVQTFDDHSEEVGRLSHRPVENRKLNGHKASENQRGVRRRCLQFEEIPRRVENSNISLNHASNDNSMIGSKSRHMEFKETSGNQITGLTQSSANLKNISVASKPLGIGLHLNSVVVAASLRCTATAGKKSTDQSVGVGGTKSGLLESTNRISMPLSVPEKDSGSNKEILGSTEALIVANAVHDQFLGSIDDHFAALDEAEKSDSQKADNFEDHDQSSLRKKRKKSTSGDGADGCKRCSCKKTKCLKLYCDCFAAGVYCSGPCSCQECFNRPDHKDAVRDAREQIESRNPLAFAPKIVQRTSELPPSNGEAGNGSTPCSARHKRGCNCKKSMCLKKYCECYQANVGCSSGCRCEGCKNVYGRKEESVPMEYVLTREMMIKKASNKLVESTLDKPSEMVETKGDQPCTESVNMHNLTPHTPSFQHSEPLGKAASKSRFLAERHLPSSDSDISVLSSNEKPTEPPPRDVLHSGMVSEICEALQGQGSNECQADYDKGISGSVSSKCESVSNARLLSARHCINVSQNHKCPEREHLSSCSFTRHGSPLTPTPRLGGTKQREGPDSSCELVGLFEDDETPTRVSSPNKKRVSPPQSHIYKLGSGSSGPLKSGRKFILRSVPSFPPLTPCLDSKGTSTPQTTDKLQDNSMKN